MQINKHLILLYLNLPYNFIPNFEMTSGAKINTINYNQFSMAKKRLNRVF